VTNKPYDRRTILKTLPIAASGCAFASACGVGHPVQNSPDMHGTDMKLSTDMMGGPDMAGPVMQLVSFGAFPALMTVGSGISTYTTAGAPLIVIRTGPTTAIALDGRCTHQGCTVAYVAAAMNLQCPCHGSKYALSGAVTMGPATQPLKSHTAVVGANGITVTIP
jgi:nitrite reductase/ring-hydroxylating ferredoxin subunit